MGTNQTFTDNPSPTVLNKDSMIRGCLLGGAVGDAFGDPLEFMRLKDLRLQFDFSNLNGYQNSKGIGYITDDTQMSLFTAEGLIRHFHKQDPEANPINEIYQAYQRWLFTQRNSKSKTKDDGLLRFPELFAQRAPGMTCLEALSYRIPGSISKKINNSKGCGGVMRSAPCGLLARNAEEAYILGRDSAALTHTHPSGYYSAVALAHIVFLIFHGSGIPSAVSATIERLRKDPEALETLQFLELAVEKAATAPAIPESIALLGEGWVGEEALAIAVFCSLKSENDFLGGIRLAVFHDGDSDSTGAITGNILGTYLGVNAIPDNLLTNLKERDIIEEVAADISGTLNNIDGHFRNK